MRSFAIAVLDGALGASVAITLDVLRTANQLAESVGKPTVTWRIIGSEAVVRMSNGLLLEAEPLSPRLRLGRATLIVPGLGLESPHSRDAMGRQHPRPQPGQDLIRYDPEVLRERLALKDAQQLGDLLRRHHARGNTVAASCSGVLILGSAGMLDGRTATTHWRLYELLQSLCPTCTVDVSRMVVQDDGLVTAGAAMAQMDLMLHLIREELGHQIADMTMRYLLLDGRPTQSHYMVLSHLQSTDDTVRRLEAIVEESMPAMPSLQELAEALHMSEKTMARRVQKATGQTPLALIQAVRLRHAQHLLETTRLTIDEIALRVGYADATALRKLTLKALHVAPGQLRGRQMAAEVA